MIHDPCDSNTHYSCWADEKCTKGFPKPFQEETEIGDDAYPRYRRHKNIDGGYIAYKYVRGKKSKLQIKMWFRTPLIYLQNLIAPSILSIVQILKQSNIFSNTI